jgi:osmotically-inducible protein OsmY
MKTKRFETWERVSKQAKRCIRALVLSGLMLSVAGCAGDKPPRTAGQTIDDQAISRRVQEALSADPAYKFADVKVVTYEGKVQLSGFVDRDEQKGQAEAITRKVAGVKEVRNQIVKK